MPSGLQFEGNPGRINVTGTGRIIQDSDFIVPLDASNFSNGLQVNPGKTLALIGGDILLEGGVLAAKNGRIELGSIDAGNINIKQENDLWFFNYEKNPIFRDIKLSGSSLVYVNSYEGLGNTINIQGREIKVLGGSLIFAQNQGYKYNGEITINAYEILEVKDSTQFSLSAIFSSNFGNTPGENIKINAKTIDIEGAQIATATYSNASGGDITVNSDDYLKIAGSDSSAVNPYGYGGINTFSYINYGGSGDITGRVRELILDDRGNITTTSSSFGVTGNLKLTTENITLKNGSTLGSTTFNMGKGGNVLINASNFIEIIGGAPFTGSSAINSSTFGSGSAGDLEINTAKLFIRDGGGIFTSTVSFGNAGSLTINASDLIEISGEDSNSMSPSFIDSSASILDERLRARFSQVPPTPTGEAGNLTLNTRNLNIVDGAIVSVENAGSGNAGRIQINANATNITNNGGIIATTAVGQGGDIDINSNNVFLNNGIISTTAGQQGADGDGGNTTINTNILVLAENSKITANAFKGRGGNIEINTRGLFFSPSSKITASSQFGLDGNVKINSFYVDPSGIKSAPEGFTEALKIASVCQSRSGGATSKFVVTDIDSLLPSPNDLPSNNPIWQDNSLSVENNNSSEDLKSITQEVAPIIEVQALIKRSDGTVVLTTDFNTNVVSADAELFASLCSGETEASTQ